jgi:hypothetical protein
MNYFKFFSIVTIAVILGLTSCKEGDTDTRELTGTWKTMNKDDYNIEAEGTLSSVIINMLKTQKASFMPPTIVFNEDLSGSFIYSDNTTTEFKYIKIGNTINITATGMKINKTKLPLVLITSTYSINSANELHLVIDALNITKAYLTALGAPYNAYTNKITKAEISCWYKK